MIKIAINTDNELNMITAYNILNLFHLSSFGHNLDLAINKGLNKTNILQLHITALEK